MNNDEYQIPSGEINKTLYDNYVTRVVGYRDENKLDSLRSDLLLWGAEKGLLDVGVVRHLTLIDRAPGTDQTALTNNRTRLDAINTLIETHRDNNSLDQLKTEHLVWGTEVGLLNVGMVTDLVRQRQTEITDNKTPPNHNDRLQVIRTRIETCQDNELDQLTSEHLVWGAEEEILEPVMNYIAPALRVKKREC
ncbi:MAG: hypothetical protein V4568_02520 [Pseudomonadota bacterium]